MLGGGSESTSMAGLFGMYSSGRSGGIFFGAVFFSCVENKGGFVIGWRDSSSERSKESSSDGRISIGALVAGSGSGCTTSFAAATEFRARGRE